MTPVKTDDGKVTKFVGVQVDVTSRTEGKNTYDDSTKEKLLVKYDDRLRQNMAKNIVSNVMEGVQQAEDEVVVRHSKTLNMY